MQRRPKFVVISSEIRRDLAAPFRLMERFDLYHLYNRNTWHDMRLQDYEPHDFRFRTPWGLYRLLRNLKPDVVQGPEPFSLLMLPFLLAVYLYLVRYPAVKGVSVTLEPLSVQTKYGRVLALIFRKVLMGWFKRVSLVFWYVPGTYEQLRAHGASDAQLVNALYGCWGVEEMFSPEGPRFSYPSRPVVLYVGRLVKEKGLFVLIEAFQQLHHRGIRAHLAFVGDGRDREQLQRQVTAFGLNNSVRFYGSVKNVDLPQYVRAADVFVLPSLSTRLWVEQVGTSGWQALASGVPTVVSDTQQLREFFPATCSIGVAPGDAQALASALEDLLVNQEKRRRMGEAALTFARERLNVQKNVLRAEEFILSCGDASVGLFSYSGSLNSST